MNALLFTGALAHRAILAKFYRYALVRMEERQDNPVRASIRGGHRFYNRDVRGPHPFCTVLIHTNWEQISLTYVTEVNNSVTVQISSNHRARKLTHGSSRSQNAQNPPQHLLNLSTVPGNDISGRYGFVIPLFFN